MRWDWLALWLAVPTLVAIGYLIGFKVCDWRARRRARWGRR